MSPADPDPSEGPYGDPARHRTRASLDAGLEALPAAPTYSGRLALIVRRLPGGFRETPAEVRLSVEEGVPGDAWSHRPPRKPDAQLAVMRRDVADLIANGQALTLFGDNLFVDLDVSAGNLPVGAELRVGGARVVMTAEPHDGCRKFHQRFGNDALRFVQARETRDQNRRGVYWRVVESGLARVGNAVEVVSRGSEL
jgi:MOSC domain-containing protein YiiM